MSKKNQTKAKVRKDKRGTSTANYEPGVAEGMEDVLRRVFWINPINRKPDP